MKKILCITYRDWANRIYDSLETIFPEYDFKIIPGESSLEALLHLQL